MSSEILTATINYLQWDDAFLREKPYLLRIESSESGLSQSNFVLTASETSIQDLRTSINGMNFREDGIALLDFETNLSHQDFYDPFQVQQIYLPRLTEALRTYLGADDIAIIPHPIDGALKAVPAEVSLVDGLVTSLYKVRKRHPDFPISTGVRYDYEQPANVAHVDATVEELATTVAKVLPGSSVDTESCTLRYQWVNIWKPIRGPLTDWPLALCKLGDTPFPASHTAVDLVYPNAAREIHLVLPDHEQSWYYLKNQTDSEHLLFLQAEIHGDKSRSGVAHAAFNNPNTIGDEPPRESIEVIQRLFDEYKVDKV